MILKQKEQYFKNYGSYPIYYKARILSYTLTNNYKIKDFELLKSYNTFICIYFDNTIILNKEYYNCSYTTKKQLEFYLENKKVLNKYYVNDKIFYQLVNDILFDNLEKFLKTFENIKKIAKIQQNIINNLKYDKENFLNFILDNPNTTIFNENIKVLKTRIKRKITIEYFYTKLTISFSTKKEKRISKYKINDIENTLYCTDLRKFNEKVFYNGYDIGISNNKELTYKGF